MKMKCFHYSQSFTLIIDASSFFQRVSILVLSPNSHWKCLPNINHNMVTFERFKLLWKKAMLYVDILILQVQIWKVKIGSTEIIPIPNFPTKFESLVSPLMLGDRETITGRSMIFTKIGRYFSYHVHTAKSQNNYLIYCYLFVRAAPQATVRAGKIRNSGAWKTMLLAIRSGAHCVPRNFVPLVRLWETHICLIVYLVVYHICKIILNSALDNLCYYYAISTYIWQPASLIDRPTVLVICRNQNCPQSSVIFWCFYPYEIYAQWSIRAGLDNQLASASKLIKWGKNKYKNPTNLLSILFAFATIQHGHQVAAV